MQHLYIYDLTAFAFFFHAIAFGTLFKKFVPKAKTENLLHFSIQFLFVFIFLIFRFTHIYLAFKTQQKKPPSDTAELHNFSTTNR
jgi:hypothetical protein